jgi:hypothetical protein
MVGGVIRVIKEVDETYLCFEPVSAVAKPRPMYTVPAA